MQSLSLRASHGGGEGGDGCRAKRAQLGKSMIFRAPYGNPEQGILCSKMTVARHDWLAHPKYLPPDCDFINNI